jgi:hypothetical protein
MVIMAVMATLAALALPSLKTSGEVTQAAYDIAGLLEQARTLAMSRGTYVWVGISEENPGDSSGAEGTGQVVISVISSKDGTKIYSDSVSTPTPLTSSKLEQVSKLFKISKMHLDVLPADAVSRAEVPASSYQIGSADFAKLGGSPNLATFTYPLTGTPKYTFVKIIEFNPQGDASKIVDTPTRWMEIGLRTARGKNADNASKNVVAIQIAGIGGQVSLLRP